MRNLTLLLLLAGTAPSAFAVKPATVEQLQQEIAALKGKPDTQAARQLSDLELTERLSGKRFAELQTQTPGPKAQEALRIIADVSAFLKLPPAEVPQTPAPDFPSQRGMLTQAIHYVARTIPQLPHFSASRVTTRFEDARQENIHGDAVLTSYGYQPLHFAGISNSIIIFRDGHEVIEGTGKSKKNEPANNELTTEGEFGPLLVTVLLDIAHSTANWSHWEEIQGKTVAVFAFSVPREQSHYQVGADETSRGKQQFAGYHGQIAVDSEDGTVFRIVVEADLKPRDPISRADMLVEYGPVEIGGRPFICPLRSVAILIDNAVPTATKQNVHTVQISPTVSGETLAPHTQTQLDEVYFTQYHLFRAESRIIP
jgi:hypothetical protein